MRLDEITKEVRWKKEDKGQSPGALQGLEIRKRRLMERPEEEKENQASVLLCKPSEGSIKKRGSHRLCQILGEGAVG